MNEYIALKENLCMLEEFYSTDDTEEEFQLQNYYLQFERMLENGGCAWTKVTLEKKRIIWRNPANGFAIAVLRDLNYINPFT